MRDSSTSPLNNSTAKAASARIRLRPAFKCSRQRFMLVEGQQHDDDTTFEPSSDFAPKALLFNTKERGVKSVSDTQSFSAFARTSMMLPGRLRLRPRRRSPYVVCGVSQFATMKTSSSALVFESIVSSPVTKLQASFEQLMLPNNSKDRSTAKVRESSSLPLAPLSVMKEESQDCLFTTTLPPFDQGAPSPKAVAFSQADTTKFSTLPSSLYLPNDL